MLRAHPERHVLAPRVRVVGDVPVTAHRAQVAAGQREPLGGIGFLVDADGRAFVGNFGFDLELPAAFGQLVVAPDGCCLDAEGALWVADATGGRLIRVRESGEIVDQVVTGSGVYAYCSQIWPA